MGNTCAYCGVSVESDDPEVYKEAIVWIGGEKSNLSVARTYTGKCCCKGCVAALKEGQIPGQADLFSLLEEHPESKPPISDALWEHMNLSADEAKSGWTQPPLPLEKAQ